MLFYGMLRRVALIRTVVLEESIFSIIKETRIGELGKTLAVTNNRRTLRRNVTANIVSVSPIFVTSEISVLTRATRRNVPEDGILRIDLIHCQFLSCGNINSIHSSGI
jgi:hypothetical protein